MIIVKAEGGYGITFALDEYTKVEAETVEYNKKSLKCTFYVEAEEVTVSGTFKGDAFSGKVSYSEGDFDITAARTEE